MAAVRPAKPPPATSARRPFPEDLFTFAMFEFLLRILKTANAGRQASMKLMMALSVMSGATSLT
jgi:hypothetical protein